MASNNTCDSNIYIQKEVLLKAIKYILTRFPFKMKLYCSEINKTKLFSIFV